jgi:hypothetical protein
LDIDARTATDFEILHTQKSSTGVHIEVRCLARVPATFRGLLIVCRSGTADLAERARHPLR